MGRFDTCIFAICSIKSIRTRRAQRSPHDSAHHHRVFASVLSQATYRRQPMPHIDDAHFRSRRRGRQRRARLPLASPLLFFAEILRKFDFIFLFHFHILFSRGFGSAV